MVSVIKTLCLQFETIEESYFTTVRNNKLLQAHKRHLTHTTHSGKQVHTLKSDRFCVTENERSVSSGRPASPAQLTWQLQQLISKLNHISWWLASLPCIHWQSSNKAPYFSRSSRPTPDASSARRMATHFHPCSPCFILCLIHSM